MSVTLLAPRTSRTVDYVADPGVLAPIRGSSHAAAYDLCATEDLELRPWKAVLTSSGIKMQLPAGHALLVLPRSGFSFKNQVMIPNSLGLIDEDYRGYVGITLMWAPDPSETIEVVPYTNPAGHHLFKVRHKEDARFRILKGHRIAQAMLIQYSDINWRNVDALSSTARGDGAFGSTGLRAEDAGAACERQARPG